MLFLWFEFITCTLIILFSGKRVARYADVISEKTGLSGLWIGVVLLAVTTSLPEIFTGIGSILFVNAPDLTMGNLFGANSYNLLNIALLDFLSKDTSLFAVISTGQLLTAGLSLIPLLIAAAGIILGPFFPALSFKGVSVFSIIIFAVYLSTARVIFNFERKQQMIARALKKEEEKPALKYNDITLFKASLYFGIFAVLILSSGLWLAYIGDKLAVSLGLQRNFIGSLFLGFSTTLPEITVSISALRLGAREMAVANMLGSNLFNMTIIFINDLIYRRAPIFEAVSRANIFPAAVVLLMSLIVISGFIKKTKKKIFLGLSVYSWGLIVVFVVGAYINFSSGF